MNYPAFQEQVPGIGRRDPLAEFLVTSEGGLL
jgi:hypothetical protein